MIVSVSLLLLLVPVFSLCGATEYYVRPTEPTNTSCPGQPCLTLSQYSKDSDHYFKSNTVFKFLPGTHRIDRPVLVTNIQNISFQSFHDQRDQYPHVVAQFHSDFEICRCDPNTIDCIPCDAISFHEVADVIIKGINITVFTSNISGIILSNVSNISVQSTTVYSRSSNPCSFGILIYQAESVQVNLVGAYNFTVGFFMEDASNVWITNITTRYNEDGIYLENIHNTEITNTTITHNGKEGIKLLEVSYTFLKRTTAMYNGIDGIYLNGITNSGINITITTHNNRGGMILQEVYNTYIVETTAAYNNKYGMGMKGMDKTLILNTTLHNNGLYGMLLTELNNTCIISTTAMHNGYHGIEIFESKYTFISNTLSLNNTEGIGMKNMHITKITNTIARENRKYGIFLKNMSSTCLTNTTVIRNRLGGIVLDKLNNSNIKAITASYNGGSGFSMYFLRNTSISDTTIQNNSDSRRFLKEYSLKFGYFFKIHVQISIWSSTETVIKKSSFSGINPPSSVGTTNPSTLPAIIGLYQSTLEISECSFKQNHISAVTAHESNITLSDNVVFSNNTAVSGTAFILVQGSIISLAKSSNVKFENNYATNTGGVFYIIVNDYIYLGDTFSHRKCFLNTPVDRSQIQFTFVNNSAGMGGDILYGGQVTFAFDGDWNCLESFENISTINDNQNKYSLISSAPSRVCFCNKSGIPDCTIFSNKRIHSIYPGQDISFSAVTVGQNFGTVAGSVYAQYLKRSPTDYLLKLSISQKVQSVTPKSCNKLSYTLFSPNSVTELILVLTAERTILSSKNNQTYSNQTKSLLQQFYHTSRIQTLLYSNNPIYITISVLPCPLGFLLKSDPPFKCDCNQLLQQIPGVYCDIQTQTFGRSGMVWVGMTHGDNGSNGTVVASQYCPLNYCNKKGGNVTLANPDSQCNYNHSGILCGACQPGLSLALGSGRCLPCTNKYLALLIPFTLAGPVLVGFIKLLDLTVSQGTFNGLIFYANVIQANYYIFLPSKSTNILSIFIAWLNLDLGVETCFVEGLDAYYKTWLQFVFPFYIWSIAGLIIILSKYSRRVAKVMGNNSVPVLATLFLLSYAKLFSIIITALSYTILYTSEGRKVVWSADGNMEYMSPKHTLLFVVAVASLLFLWLPYTLILFLGQWLHMCNCRLIVRFLFKMKPFLDAHYAPLNDKHRYWFGALHLVRAAILLVSALIPADHYSIVTISILVSAAVLMYFGSVVYHKTVIAMFNMGFFLNLIFITGTTFCVQIVGGDSTIYVYPLTGLSLLQLVGLVIFKVYSIFKKSSTFMACIHMSKRQHVEDEWELFEQADFQRERESEYLREDSEVSGSVESLPTY